MGNWKLTIEGTGQHHNGLPQDADKVAKDTVATVVALGHNVTHAEFAVAGGQADNLLPEPTSVESGATDLGQGAGAAAEAEAGSDRSE